MKQIRIAGILGYETARRLLEEHREELEKRFAGFFIDRIERLSSRTVPETEIAPLMNTEGIYVTPVTEGGLFAALWKTCEDLENGEYSWANGYHGCEVDLAKVPVMQEVTEVCELYGENPYEASSAGTWLIVREENEDWESEKSGLCIQEQSAIIGKLIKNCRRVVTAGDAVRYLTPPDRQKKDIENRKNEV